MAKYRFLPTTLPKISKYARDRERPNTKYFQLRERAVEVHVDQLSLDENDPRIEDMDWAHVDDIFTNLLEAGADEDGKLPAVVDMGNDQYSVIDNHHLIAALQKLEQEKWYVDVYEYTGINPDFLWDAATDFGFSINNSHNPTKKTTIASVVGAGVKRWKEKGYIYEPGTPLDRDHIDMWLRLTKQHEVFAPASITRITNQILNPTVLAGKKIRNLSTESIREEVLNTTDNYYGSGLIRNGSAYGFVVGTNTYGADAPKWWNQVQNAIDDGYLPVIQTYSTKDTPELIVKNHKKGFDKMYEAFVKTTKIISNFYSNISIVPLTKKEFYNKVEYVAIGQLDGEYTDENTVIERTVV